MAKHKDAEPGTDHEAKDTPAARPAPGTDLEIETLDAAAAGTITRTIRIKIDDPDLNAPAEPDNPENF